MSILSDIVASKRREIARRRASVSEAELGARLRDAPPPRNFAAALRADPSPQIIAEIKRASPSAGVIREDFDPTRIARIYEEAGAAAISVLTDEPYFHGSLRYLAIVRRVVDVPILRKDFILDRYQLLEARAAGADAVLLIAEILDQPLLESLLRETENLGMQALVELYEPENLERVVAAGAAIIGINNRNLKTFETRLEHTLDLLPRIPRDRCIVSESGIRCRGDVDRLRCGGVHALLIGETLMRAADIGGKLRELLGNDPCHA